MAADGDLTVALDGVDLALDRMNILDGCEIEVSAPDERAQVFQELGTGNGIARHGAGLDHRRALPILAHPFVIGFRGQHRHGEGRGSGIGPQPEIGAIDITVFGEVLQQADQIASQAHEAILEGSPAAIIDLVAVIEDDQVNVAGVVEFAGTELAHAENDEAGAFAWTLERWKDKIACGRRAAQQVIDGEPERALGEIGERAGDFLDLPAPGDVGQRDQERRAPARPAQDFHQLRILLGTRGLANQTVCQIGQDMGGILG